MRNKKNLMLKKVRPLPKLPKTSSKILFLAGQVFPYLKLLDLRQKNWPISKRLCTSGLLIKKPQLPRLLKLFVEAAQGLKTPSGRSEVLFSWVQPVSVRPSLPKHWQIFYLVPKKLWSVLI